MNPIWPTKISGMEIKKLSTTANKEWILALFVVDFVIWKSFFDPETVICQT